MKQLHTVLTIEEAIAVSIHALEKGAGIDWAQKALIMDGFEPERAKSIVRWAKLRVATNNKENEL